MTLEYVVLIIAIIAGFGVMYFAGQLFSDLMNANDRRRANARAYRQRRRRAKRDRRS